MLSSIEETYSIGLINQYIRKGYKYYVLHTVTETNTNWDICLYVSKNPIVFITDNYFRIEKGLKILIDSSSRNDNTYNPSLGSRDLLYAIENETNINIDVAEFIYTNANSNYNENTIALNPDILLSHPNSYFDIGLGCLSLFISVFLGLYAIIKTILRIRW